MYPSPLVWRQKVIRLLTLLLSESRKRHRWPYGGSPRPKSRLRRHLYRPSQALPFLALPCLWMGERSFKSGVLFHRAEKWGERLKLLFLNWRMWRRNEQSFAGRQAEKWPGNIWEKFLRNVIIPSTINCKEKRKKKKSDCLFNVFWACNPLRKEERRVLSSVIVLFSSQMEESLDISSCARVVWNNEQCLHCPFI